MWSKTRMERIGIRREDKSRWEARAPVTPEAVAKLIADHGLAFAVERSDTRAFEDEQYTAAGAAVSDNLSDCPIIMGVKEIPPERLEAEKAYVFFSHTIKGQADNMPMLRRLMELRGTLIDYEKITDDQGRRLVFFGRFAGIAGMIDTLWALGERLKHEGIDTPFARIQPAHRYHDLDHARAEIRAVGDAIRNDGLPDALTPFVCGFAGYGQVSLGAQEIYDLLPVREIAPDELERIEPGGHACFKVVFKEEHLVERIDASRPFELQEYYDFPERYRSDFIRHVPYLTVLVNCIYWEPRYPRLISQRQFRELYGQSQPTRLRVIGDITCDIDGSLACTTRATDPAHPIYVYDPVTGETRDGAEGNGPVVLAVDFLPCEIPIDASRAFSDALCPFLPGLAKADLTKPLGESGLPPELRRATIVHRGRLTEAFEYLERYVASTTH
jgi:alpha-aminoadipic semialdehyde synthase